MPIIYGKDKREVIITNIHFGLGDKETILYAELKDQNTGELLAKGTLEYITLKLELSAIERINEEKDSLCCKKCGSPLNQNKNCTDVTCPFSDKQQSETYSEG